MEKEILKDTGLSDREIEIYLALLKAGKATVTNLAKLTGLHRTNIYDTLEKLKGKGLVVYLREENRLTFHAVEPERLLEILDEKKENIKGLLPGLKAMMESEKEEPVIKIYKGKEGLKILLKEALKAKSELLGINISEKRFFDNVPLQFEQYIREMEKIGFRERLLAEEGTKYFTGSKNSQYRFLKKEFFGPTTTNIFGNKMFIIIWEPVLTLIMIESKTVANDYRKHFELLWKMGKKK